MRHQQAVAREGEESGRTRVTAVTAVTDACNGSASAALSHPDLLARGVAWSESHESRDALGAALWLSGAKRLRPHRDFRPNKVEGPYPYIVIESGVCRPLMMDRGKRILRDVRRDVPVNPVF